MQTTEKEMDAAVYLYKGELLANQLMDDLLALDQPDADPLRYRQLYWIPFLAAMAGEDDFEARWRDTVLDIVLKEMEVSEEELSRFHRNFVAAEQQLLAA